ncbi:MAG: hypothetical protein ACRD2A_03950, partial [Vicinamibacterales bacterium]
TRTYRNADGTYRLEAFPGPVHYRDTDGDWQPIDSTLIASDRPGYAHRNRANSFTAHFRRQLADADVYLDLGQIAYSFTLQGTSPAAAVVTGSQARYANVAPSTDLAYGVTNVGLKETLRLRSWAAPNEFKYLIRGPGSVTTQNEDSSIIVRDVLDRGSFTIAAPWAQEAPANSDDDPTPPVVPHASQSIRLNPPGFGGGPEATKGWLHAQAKLTPQGTA